MSNQEELTRIVNAEYIIEKMEEDFASLIGGIEETESLMRAANSTAPLIIEKFLDEQLPRWHEAMCIRFETMKRALERGQSIQDYLSDKMK